MYLKIILDIKISISFDFNQISADVALAGEKDRDLGATDR